MFWVLFLVLGLCFGYAARMPWALLAFVVPLGLAVAAADRDLFAIVLGFIVTAVGIVGGLALAARSEQQHAA